MCPFGAYVLLSTLLEVQTFFRIVVRLFQKFFIFFPIPLSCIVSQLQSVHTRSYNVHIWSLCANEHTSRGSNLLLNSCWIILVNLEFYPIPLSFMVSQLQSVHARSYNVRFWTLCASEHTSRGPNILQNSCEIILETFHFLLYSSILHGFIARVRADQIL